MSNTPTVSYGDAMSVGQLAQQWGRTTSLVHGLVSNGHLAVDSRGLVRNEELARFYAQSGTLLDA